MRDSQQIRGIGWMTLGKFMTMIIAVNLVMFNRKLKIRNVNLGLHGGNGVQSALVFSCR